MRNTKELILKSALKLFNENGFSNVTIRMIAKEVGISSGNLNYHFKTKHQILETLYFAMIDVFDARLEVAKSKDYDLYVLITGMRESMTIMYQYRFIWSDLYYLYNQNETIQKHHKNSIMKKLSSWKMILEKLMDAGYLKEETLIYPNNLIVNRIVDFANSWIFATSLYKNYENEIELVEDQAKYLFTILYPYFTEKGLKEYESIIH